MILTSCSIYSQKLTCKDFKEGIFIVPKDSLVPFSYKIIRKGNRQIEFAINLNEIKDKELRELPELNQKAFELIEWVDDCSYKLKYAPSKMSLTKSQQFINDNGGILTELIKIKENCFYYKSTLKANGKIQRLDGVFCKS